MDGDRSLSAIWRGECAKVDCGELPLCRWLYILKRLACQAKSRRARTSGFTASFAAAGCVVAGNCKMVGELDDRGGGGKERVETEGVTPSSASLAHPPRSPVLIGWTLSSCPPHPFDQTPSSQIHHPPPAPASQWPPSRLSRRCCASWPPGKVQHMASEARVDRAASQPLN